MFGTRKGTVHEFLKEPLVEPGKKEGDQEGRLAELPCGSEVNVHCLEINDYLPLVRITPKEVYQGRQKTQIR
jgi:hypothetical protein